MSESSETPSGGQREPIDSEETDPLSQPAPSAPPATVEPAGASASADPAPREKGSGAVRYATIVVAVICVALLVLYLIGDRFTPYTNQPRLTAIVVPIAPQVSGAVVEVLVKENQEVELGQVLFTIDRTNYELALQASGANLQAAELQEKSWTTWGLPSHGAILRSRR